eukprot:1391384-Rhodomonas_salina.1
MRLYQTPHRDASFPRALCTRQNETETRPSEHVQAQARTPLFSFSAALPGLKREKAQVRNGERVDWGLWRGQCRTLGGHIETASRRVEWRPARDEYKSWCEEREGRRSYRLTLPRFSSFSCSAW